MAEEQMVGNVAIYDPPRKGLPYLFVFLGEGGVVLTSRPHKTRKSAEREMDAFLKDFAAIPGAAVNRGGGN